MRTNRNTLKKNKKKNALEKKKNFSNWWLFCIKKKLFFLMLISISQNGKKKFWSVKKNERKNERKKKAAEVWNWRNDKISLYFWKRFFECLWNEMNWMTRRENISKDHLIGHYWLITSTTSDIWHFKLCCHSCLYFEFISVLYEFP